MRVVLVWLFVGVLSGAATSAWGGFGDVVFQFDGPAGIPSGLCYDGWYICVVDTTQNIIFTYDPGNGQNVGSLVLGAGWYPGGLGWDSVGSFFWMGENFTQTIKKIHPQTGIELFSIPAPVLSNPYVSGVAYGNGYVWSTNRSSPSAAYKQDPVTGIVLDTLQAPGPEASGLAFDGVNLWIADANRDSIYKVLQDGTVEAGFPAPAAQPKGLGFDGSYLWNVDAGTHEIYKIDISGPGVEESGHQGIPPVVRLEVCPNPFRSAASVNLTMHGSANTLKVSVLQIYDAGGRLVLSYDWGTSPEQKSSFVWYGVDSQGSRVASGVYFIRVRVGTATFSEAAYLIR